MQARMATIDRPMPNHTKRWGAKDSEITIVPGPFGWTNHPFREAVHQLRSTERVSAAFASQPSL